MSGVMIQSDELREIMQCQIDQITAGPGELFVAGLFSDFVFDMMMCESNR